MDKNEAILGIAAVVGDSFWDSEIGELTRPEQVFRMVYELDWEVTNGGFEQYFYNASGDCARQAPAALREIGAHNAAEIVEFALRIFPMGSPPAEWEERQSFVENLSKETKRSILDRADSQYYDLPDYCIMAQLHDFVSTHKDEIREATRVLQ